MTKIYFTFYIPFFRVCEEEGTKCSASDSHIDNVLKDWLKFARDIHEEWLEKSLS